MIGHTHALARTHAHCVATSAARHRNLVVTLVRRAGRLRQGCAGSGKGASRHWRDTGATTAPAPGPGFALNPRGRRLAGRQKPFSSVAKRQAKRLDEEEEVVVLGKGSLPGRTPSCPNSGGARRRRDGAGSTMRCTHRQQRCAATSVCLSASRPSRGPIKHPVTTRRRDGTSPKESLRQSARPAAPPRRPVVRNIITLNTAGVLILLTLRKRTAGPINHGQVEGAGRGPRGAIPQNDQK